MKRLFAFILSVVMIVSSSVPALAETISENEIVETPAINQDSYTLEDETIYEKDIPYFDGEVEVNLNVQYGQNEARKITNLINDFRKTPGVWAWDTNNRKKYYNNLPELTYDYKLEQIAMQRAVEIALVWGHNRYDGMSATNYLRQFSYWNGQGECIYAGASTASEAFQAWREDNATNYQEGCHRWVMLEARGGIGVGHVIYNGNHYWAIEFGSPVSGAAETVARNDSEIVKQTIMGNTVNYIYWQAPDEIEITAGQSVSAPSVISKWNLKTAANDYYNNIPIKIDEQWSGYDSNIIKIENGLITGLTPGVTYITSKKSYKHSFTVKVVVLSKGGSSKPSNPTPAPTPTPTPQPQPSGSTNYLTSNQRAIFPLRRLQVNQGRYNTYNTYSHQKQNAVDFSPANKIDDSGWEYAYAPFDGKVVKMEPDQHAIWYQSNNLVEYANGEKEYMTVLFMHGEWDDPEIKEGFEYKQGQKMFRAGGWGSKSTSYDKHFHIEIIKGKASGWGARGNVNIEDALWVNTDFTIKIDKEVYNWKKFSLKEMNIQLINDFVERMYTKALGRVAEAAGLKDWSSQLANGTADGATLARGFIASDEFKKKYHSNEEFVDILYRTFFDREPDEAGRNYWLSILNEYLATEDESSNDQIRTQVLAGFVNSQEFSNLCDEYGIARGTMEADGSNIYNKGVRDFVLRNYEKALGRKGETMGVEDWSHKINTGQMSALDVAQSFFHSQEFLNKNTSNEEYVEILYETFLGRTSDPAGKADWVGQLNGGRDRDEVMKGFAYSQEFKNIMAQYGL